MPIALDDFKVPDLTDKPGLLKFVMSTIALAILGLFMIMVGGLSFWPVSIDVPEGWKKISAPSVNKSNKVLIFLRNNDDPAKTIVLMAHNDSWTYTHDYKKSGKTGQYC